MRDFAALSVLMMLLVATGLGVRLLLTARRTRQLPELLLGIGFLGCGVGVGVGQLGMGFVWTEESSLATVMNTALFAPVVIGVVALNAAVWRVFHSHDIYGFLSFAVGSSLALVAYGMRIGAGDFSARVVESTGMQVFTFSLISVLSWAAMEALNRHRLLRKQVRLGLAEPLAATQVALWGVAATLSAVMTSVVAYNVLSLHRSPLDDTFATAFLLLAVLGASGAMWCAFFPPARLRARLEAPRTQG